MPSNIEFAASQYIEDHQNDEHLDVTLRFKNVEDVKLLMIDLELMLESLGEEGFIIDDSSDD